MQKYKIRNFSQHMGVSLDTIKHYQQCGILTPFIDPDNNYRYYNITHGERLIVSRKFRNLDFTIDDTKALISSKDGPEIVEMLNTRKEEILSEMNRLQNQLSNINYFTKTCELFNEHAGTYQICNKPAYYFYRHTYNSRFVESTKDDPMIKDLINNLPYTVKLQIIRSDFSEHYEYNHCIAIKEDSLSSLHGIDLTKLEFSPEKKAIRYIYSEPAVPNKMPTIDNVKEQLCKDGYTFSDDNIYVENAIDFYRNGVRYRNNIIYFCLK